MMTGWSLRHPEATAGIDGLARVALGNVASDSIDSTQASRARA